MPPLYSNWATNPCLFMSVQHPRHYIQMSVMPIFLQYVTSQRTLIGCVDINARTESMFSFALVLSRELMSFCRRMCSVDTADMLSRPVAWIVVGTFRVHSSAILRVKNSRRSDAFSVLETRTEKCTTSRAKLSSLEFCELRRLSCPFIAGGNLITSLIAPWTLFA